MEGYILARQAVCADDDIDLPLLEIAEDGTKLLWATGTRDIVYPHGEVTQSLREGAVVLIGKDSSRDEDGYLLAIGRCLEGCSYGYLGLPEAHISTKEAVHREGALHVGLHSCDGRSLVWGVLEGKRCL